MENLNRRRFLQVSAAGAAGLMSSLPAAPAIPPGKPFRLGIIIGVAKDPDAALKRVHDFGVPTCQAGTDDFSDRVYAALKGAIEKYGMEVTATQTSPFSELDSHCLFVEAPSVTGSAVRGLNT